MEGIALAHVQDSAPPEAPQCSSNVQNISPFKRSQLLVESVDPWTLMAALESGWLRSVSSKLCKLGCRVSSCSVFWGEEVSQSLS